MSPRPIGNLVGTEVRLARRGPITRFVLTSHSLPVVMLGVIIGMGAGLLGLPPVVACAISAAGWLALARLRGAYRVRQRSYSRRTS